VCVNLIKQDTLCNFFQTYNLFYVIEILLEHIILYIQHITNELQQLSLKLRGVGRQSSYFKKMFLVFNSLLIIPFS